MMRVFAVMDGTGAGGAETLIVRFVRRLLALCQGELDDLSARLPLRAQFLYQAVVTRMRGRGVRAIHDRDSGLLALQDRDGTVVCVAHPRRASYYRTGVQMRLERLARSYCVGASSPWLGDVTVLVDCGANCGELGMALRPARYVAFEPDPSAYKALTANMSGDLFQVALADKAGALPLFLKPESADSSLIGNVWEPSVLVQTERLDSIVDTLELESIDLLKVEAEGFEPEVLAGAERTLTRCRLVAVDCGPERDGFDTAARCVEILYDHGFKLSDTRMFSGRMLFTRGDVKGSSGNRVGEAGQ